VDVVPLVASSEVPRTSCCEQGTFVFGLLVGLYFNWKLTLVILAFMPLMGISGVMMKVCSALSRALLWLQRSTRSVWCAWRQTADTKHEVNVKNAYSLAATAAGEALSSFKTVTAFGGGKREVKKYAANLEAAEKAATKKGFNLGFAMVRCSAVRLLGASALAPSSTRRGEEVTTMSAAVAAGYSVLGDVPRVRCRSDVRGAPHSAVAP
jgi:ABC-type multidrug transport system fused ATPase/permease subunit